MYRTWQNVMNYKLKRKIVVERTLNNFEHACFACLLCYICKYVFKIEKIINSSTESKANSNDKNITQ